MMQKIILIIISNIVKNFPRNYAALLPKQPQKNQKQT